MFALEALIPIVPVPVIVPPVMGDVVDIEVTVPVPYAEVSSVNVPEAVILTKDAAA